MTKAPTLGDWLRAKGITQVQFARRLNVSPNTVHRWVVGSRRPDWQTISRIVSETDGEVTADSFLASFAVA
jgi:transcriptional regulator with XRE-family HTH domain